MRRRKSHGKLYRLKVTLRWIRPPIWRRFLVPSGISLFQLHQCLQSVMGWTDSHLHEFSAKGTVYGTPNDEFDLTNGDEMKTTLSQVMRKPKDRMTYLYDFGDSWEHEVILEAILPPQGKAEYPIVEAGRRACPPEDIGGVPGYAHMLGVLADPKHPEHEEMVEWFGESFDPAAFAVREANLDIHGGWRPPEVEA